MIISRNNILKTILLFFFTCQYSNTYAQTFTIPENPFPKPTGQYNVGTKEYLWIDNNRDDDLTADPNDKVHILIQVWYPTNDNSGIIHPYISTPEEFGDNTRYNILSNVKTNSYTNASLSNDNSKYPILIYSHGSGMSRFTNTFQAEELASHGYIIYGIDHSSNNHTQLYPDNMSTKNRKNVFYRKENENKFIDVMKNREVADRVILNYWAKDAAYVIDKIENNNNDHSNFFYGKLDIEKMGMYGYSLGGILTLQMCAQEKRIKAGINSDGGILGYVWKTGITQPFLFIEPTKTSFTEANLPEYYRDYEQYLFRDGIGTLRMETLLKNSNNDMYFLTIPNTKHNDFNDMSLFEAQQNELINVQLAHQIINDYTLSFFNKYLKNEDDNLFNSFPGKYKESKLEKK